MKEDLKATFDQLRKELISRGNESAPPIEQANDGKEILAVSIRGFECRAFAKDKPLPTQIDAPIEPERMHRFRASDDTVDRYREVIIPAGWVFDNFILNPVVMLSHNYDMLPIGNARAIGVVKNELLIDSEFDPPEIDEVADQVFQKIKRKTLRMGSVGFIPLRWIDAVSSSKSAQPRMFICEDGVNISEKKVTTKEEKLLEKYPTARRIYIEQELLEWTICSIGANPNALAASMKSMYRHRFGTDPMEHSTAEQGSDTDYTAAIKKVAGITKIFN